MGCSEPLLPPSAVASEMHSSAPAPESIRAGRYAPILRAAT